MALSDDVSDDSEQCAHVALPSYPSIRSTHSEDYLIYVCGAFDHFQTEGRGAPGHRSAAGTVQASSNQHRRARPSRQGRVNGAGRLHAGIRYTIKPGCWAGTVTTMIHNQDTAPCNQQPLICIVGYPDPGLVVRAQWATSAVLAPR